MLSGTCGAAQLVQKNLDGLAFIVYGGLRETSMLEQF